MGRGGGGGGGWRVLYQYLGVGEPLRGRPICLITGMITGRIGRHEVMLPINHNYNKISNILGFFKT